MLDTLEAFCLEMIALCYSHCYFYNSYGTLVAEGVTIFRGGEYCQGQGLLIYVVLILEPLHLHLMTSDDHLYVVGLQKFCGLSPAVKIRAASHFIVDPLFMAVVCWVAP